MVNPDSIPDILPERRFEFQPWRELAILMLVGMEVSWVTPWFRSLTPTTYAIPPLRVGLILLVLMLVSLWVVRFMDLLRIQARIRQGVTIGLLILGVLLGLKTLLYAHESLPFGQMLSRPLRNLADVRVLIPDEFIIVLTVLVGWWRGIALAQERIGPTVVRYHLIFGSSMFILFGFFNTLVTGETPGVFILIFLMCALLGMSAARFAVLNTLRGGRLIAFDRRWFVGILFASGITMCLGWFFGDIFARHLQWIAYLFLSLFSLVVMLVMVILAPLLAFLIQALTNDGDQLPFLQQVSEQIDRFREMMQNLMQRISSAVGIDELSQALTRWTPGIKLVALVTIIAVIVAGILTWLAVNLWKERKRRQLDEQQQGLIGKNEFWQLLQVVLRERWKRLVNNLENVVDFRKRARQRAAERIRQVYAELLDLSEELGYPRKATSTPLEFLPVLVECFPDQVRSLALVTQAYLKIRYGELPETRQEVLTVEKAWKQIQSAGKDVEVRRKQQKNQPGPLNVKSVQKPRSDRS